MFLQYTKNVGQPNQQVFYLSGTHQAGSGSLINYFGSIKVNSGPFNSQSFDFGRTYTGQQTLANGDSLQATWNKIVENAKYIESLKFDYDLLSTNSNALIHTLLKNAGLPDTDALEATRRDFYGADIDLDEVNGIETKDGPPSLLITPIKFYEGAFRGGGGGFHEGGNFSGSSTTFFGGSSGRWVYSSVEIQGQSNGGWRWVEATATRIKPVVLDLDGDGVELTSAESSPGFDFLGSGLAKTMGWFTGGDALLVHDANGNNYVDNGSEISFIHHSPASLSDLEALRVFDTNANGLLDPGDAAFNEFRLWRDNNQNGVSDPGELSTLNALGVHSLSLYGSGGGYEIAGNQILGTAAFTRTNGSQGTAYDVGLKAFDRGTRLIAEDGTWAVIQTEGEDVGVRQTYGSVVTSTLGSFEVLGDTRTGYQLSDAPDDISVSYGGSGNRSFYLDTAGYDDRINLGATYHGSVIKAGAGNDQVVGSTGNDHISTGTGYYDIVQDYGGDDYYFIQATNSSITDHSGTDVIVFEVLTFANAEFYHQGEDIVVASRDGSQRHFIENMGADSSYGIEFFMFADRTVTRDEAMALADIGGWRGYDARLPDEPAPDLAFAMAHQSSAMLIQEYIV
ncbi:MAG TPA: hypothetical protein VEZ48_14710 [Sphingomonadaceae bacterium]|nr:hypothetical protein [Sphingomonadaceae bacterium]